MARAIRSGITPDGRVLFWGFMPWDMFGNLDEEDVRALTAYLRTLPPQDRVAPPAVPARPDHPREISWTIDMSRIEARVFDLFRSRSAPPSTSAPQSQPSVAPGRP